jgi:HAE1 family hydrophobic/amphiphilic exporter-1
MAMVLGMLPIAVASGAGSEWKNGLGWCLVGGLTSSMCLTLFIVPAVYLVVDTIKLKLSHKKGRKGTAKNIVV